VKAKIYTKTGDKGETALVDGSRVSKGDARLESYGTLDELNSFTGLLRAKIGGNDHELVIDKHLEMIQNNLFNIGSHLACADDKMQAKLPGLSADGLSLLEGDMDRWEAELPPLKEFILPGGSEPAAVAHLARTVCRRAEREMIRLRDQGAFVDAAHLVFINRLSDWYFLLARKLNAMKGVKDIAWSKA
jgi:cob(I)alamin adenosyltransferase